MKYNLTYEEYIEMLVKLSDSLYNDKEFNEIKQLYEKAIIKK